MAKAIEYKSIKDVPKKYKWNLEALLEGETLEQLMQRAFTLYRKNVVDIKDSKYDSPESYLNSIKLYEEVIVVASRLFEYLSHSVSINVTDAQKIQMREVAAFEMYKLDMELGPELPRVIANEAKLRKWMNLPQFKEVRFLIEEQLRKIPHTLPENIEEFELQLSRGKANFSDIFTILTDAENDKGYAVNSKGRKIKISDANFSTLLESDDKKVRKTAFIAQRDSFLRIKETLAALLYQHKRAESVQANVRNYKSTVDMLMFSDFSDEALLPPLYAATAANVKHWTRYIKNYDRFYKIVFGERPTRYDRGRKLVKVEKDVPVEQGIKEVLAAFQPFGKEYISVVEKALSENWIDFFVIKNKTSGAYSGGKGIKQKLILMNWDNTTRSTETLAHELGHSLQSHLIDKNNRLALTGYPMFAAEVASIFNELILMDYWLKTSKNDREKFSIISRFITGFSSTVMRQVWFSNYEYDLYKKIDQGIPVNSYEAMSKIYYENALKYSAIKPKKFDSKQMYDAIRVPHFYYGFYVHRYAVGQLVACIFFQIYRERGPEALQSYLKNFVSVGTIDTPINILKKAGVDLYDSKTYNIGFKFFSDLVVEHEKLGNKIFRSKASSRVAKSKTK